MGLCNDASAQLARLAFGEEAAQRLLQTPAEVDEAPPELLLLGEGTSGMLF